MNSAQNQFKFPDLENFERGQDSDGYQRQLADYDILDLELPDWILNNLIRVGCSSVLDIVQLITAADAMDRLLDIRNLANRGIKELINILLKIGLKTDMINDPRLLKLINSIDSSKYSKHPDDILEVIEKMGLVNLGGEMKLEELRRIAPLGVIKAINSLNGTLNITSLSQLSSFSSVELRELFPDRSIHMVIFALMRVNRLRLSADRNNHMLLGHLFAFCTRSRDQIYRNDGCILIRKLFSIGYTSLTEVPENFLNAQELNLLDGLLKNTTPGQEEQ